jgi:hypothetical protein
MVETNMPIWRRQFWRSYWIALRRSGKDRRARHSALKISFLLAYVPAYIAFLLVTLRGQEGAFAIPLYAFLFGTGAIAFLILRRSHRRQDELLNFSLTGRGRPDTSGAGDVSPAVRRHLEERALIVGSLVARAGSEMCLRLNEVPPGLEAMARQNLNTLLRQNGLWDRLEPAEAELMSAADGRWSPEQRYEVAKWCEQLRLLRWALGVDAELMPLAHFPKVDFSLAYDLLRRHKLPQPSGPTRGCWEIRVEREISSGYTARVVAEFRGRGLMPSTPELQGWADQVRGKFLGASSDYLAGSETVGELDDATLRQLIGISHARERYAAYLVDQLSAEVPFSFAAWSKRV